MNRCGSFPLLSASHSIFINWTELNRSEKIPGAPAWRQGEWIWLTGPSGLHRNSSQGLNISSIMVFDQTRYLEIPNTLSVMPLLIMFSWSKYGTVMYYDKIFYMNISYMAAPWRKWFDAHLLSLGFLARISVTLCGFLCWRNGVWMCFSRGFSLYPLPQTSFHHFSTLISFILFYPRLWWCVRCGRPASLLFTDLQ